VTYELHPEIAEEGITLEPHPGIDEMFDTLRARGIEYGIYFRQVRILANSRKSLLVGEYAKELGKSEDYINAIYKTYFEEGLNIGDKQVIIKVAEKIGINENEVNAAITSLKYKEHLNQNMLEGRSHNVKSLPTFIINDRHRIFGAQSEQVFIKAFKMLAVDGTGDQIGGAS
jgi:Predicted dithiol-disulfide isomerase involved in polyketide biosynthesis